jgi:hypothetical protein
MGISWAFHGHFMGFRSSDDMKCYHHVQALLISLKGTREEYAKGA